MDGIEATRIIKQRWSALHVVFLATFKDDESVRAALQAGGEGYLLKSAPVADKAQRLRALSSNAAVIHTEVLRHLAEPDREPLPGLTPRESEVAQLVAQGPATSFPLYWTSVLDKLQLRDRTQLAIFYWRRRI